MILSKLAQVRGLAARENASEYGRVQRFHTTVEDTRVASQFFDGRNRDIERLDIGLSAACTV
jgi:tetrahydromethanopterin S-methyltransferase subunit F